MHHKINSCDLMTSTLLTKPMSSDAFIKDCFVCLRGDGKVSARRVNLSLQLADELGDLFKNPSACKSKRNPVRAEINADAASGCCATTGCFSR